MRLVGDISLSSSCLCLGRHKGLFYGLLFVVILIHSTERAKGLNTEILKFVVATLLSNALFLFF